ncbi:MAG TPA: GNAT family N-acetyltransferase [Armatimonadota bacterium]|jgi:predicted N-acetyltransferase YhbS
MVQIRPVRAQDLRECARICYSAFHRIATDHGFTPDIPSLEVAEHVMSFLFHHESVYGVVAEDGDRLLGSNFLDERSPIAAVGPITVDLREQNRGVGRKLMEAVLERARDQDHPGVRLVQATYHNRSLSLYAGLGFEVREPLATMGGTPIEQELPGYPVRPAKEKDIEVCARLCLRVHGHQRTGEMVDAFARGTASVVERHGGITGYTTGLSFLGHTVGETSADVKALIAAASVFPNPGFLLPTRQADLFRWCLDQGLRVIQPMTLMSLGLYNEPRGAFLPSVGF